MNSQLLSMTALGPNDPDDGDTGRQMRGMAIAARVPIGKNPLGYTVPSQTVDGHDYVVSVGDDQFCSCPDFRKKSQPCKHLYAVEFTREREQSPNGTVGSKAYRVTDSAAYNQAQFDEYEMFGRLLRELCDTIPQPAQKTGRPRLPLSDMVYAICMKVYSTKSGRRVMGEMRNVRSAGQMEVTPSFTSVARYMGMPELTPLLKSLIEHSALPLKAIESDFATDSSSFSTNVKDNWLEHKWRKRKKMGRWIKCHIMCGVQTNIVTAVEVSETKHNDTKFLAPFVETTDRNFNIEEVSADKAYISKKNLHAVDDVGAVPYIPFKKNALAEPIRGKRDSLWYKMWHLYHLNYEEWARHYHKRSNVEATFSMIKMKFGPTVRSRTVDAQVNEVLAKILCHNICVLIKSMYTLGLIPVFEDELLADKFDEDRSAA